MNETLQQKYDRIKGDRATVALVKAIRQNETDFDNAKSNPYMQRHDSGTGFGAYGFQKSTWKQWAKQYAGDENLIPTPANQDMIAALAVNDSIKQYGKAADVLSAWNSGKPASQAKKGFNKSIGLAYDTPAYINKGINNFKKYYDETPEAPSVQDVQENQTAEGDLSYDANSIPSVNGRQYGTPLKNPSGNMQRQALFDQGLPVSANPNKAEPSFLGEVARDPLKLIASGLESVRKPVQAAAAMVTGNDEMLAGADPNKPLKNPYLGDVYPLGYGKDTQGKYGMPNFRSLAKASGQGLKAATYIEGAPATAVEGLAGTLGRKTLLKSLGSSALVNGVPNALTTIADDISEKKPFVDTAIDATGSLLAGTLVDQGVKGVNRGLRSVFQPGKYTKDVINNSPEFVRDTVKASSDVARNSLPPEYVTKNFGVTDKDKALADRVFEAIGVKYRPSSFPGGKKLDVSEGLAKVAEDNARTAEKTSWITRIIPGKVNEKTFMDATMKKVDPKIRRSGPFMEVMAKLADRVERKLQNPKVGGTRSRNLSARDLNELVQEVTMDAYKRDADGSMNMTAKHVADAFRIGARDEIMKLAKQNGMNDVAKAFRSSLDEYHLGKNVESVLEDVKINPEATSQLGNHMFGLASAGITKNPFLYVPARAGSKYVGETLSELKVNDKYHSKLLNEIENQIRRKESSSAEALKLKYKKK